MKDIINYFGTSILQQQQEQEQEQTDDNTAKEMIDRKKLGAIVFSDRNEMSVRVKLQDILYSV